MAQFEILKHLRHLCTVTLTYSRTTIDKPASSTVTVHVSSVVLVWLSEF